MPKETYRYQTRPITNQKRRESKKLYTKETCTGELEEVSTKLKQAEEQLGESSARADEAKVK
jgi:hypothetical protein